MLQEGDVPVPSDTTNSLLENVTKNQVPIPPQEIVYSLSSTRNNYQLRESTNPWRPSRLKSGNACEEDMTEALYKRIRGVLNKLTPQKFTTLVNQVKALKIDSLEKFQGIVDMIFEKAIHEPNYSVVYTLMCRELAMMQVSSPDSKAGKEESNVNFRKLIITRCQMEFEKNTVDEKARVIKMEEIEACADPEKKKELQHMLTEEERRIRMTSVGTIKFIGELFKRGMLTANIMHRCIRHLLTQTDEESLECLCKLLSTIGKDLESKNQNLDPYFKQILDIVKSKGPVKVSSRVRFMLQDVIELRLSKWIPKRDDDSNPKTIDQIQKEAELERFNTYQNHAPLNTSRKDHRNSDRKRNRGARPIEEGGCSQPVSSQNQYSVETSKLKNKPPRMDNLQLANKNMFQWSRNPLPSKQNSQEGKPKSNKPAVIRASCFMREDIKLRGSEDPWKPSRLNSNDASEKDLRTENLYKTVRRVLNKMMPQKFNKLINQVKTLQIDSQDKLQRVVNLVFEKAVNEPRFMPLYALTCKELAMMQVHAPENEAGKQNNDLNFRKLIITRCAMEFEEAVDENTKAIQKRENEAIANPRNNSQPTLTEQERRNRSKSLGNIRFIGELFKQEVLTTFIMHRCILYLLTQIDDESLECLCKLLVTVGKDLESKNQKLDPYFEQLVDIVHRKVPSEVSSRVRFMLQDVIELRTNKWIPREGYSNTKMMDQIKIEAKTDGGGGSIDEGGWSQSVRNQTQDSVETSELKNKPIKTTPMDNLQLGGLNMVSSSSNGPADADSESIDPPLDF